MTSKESLGNYCADFKHVVRNIHLYNSKPKLIKLFNTELEFTPSIERFHNYEGRSSCHKHAIKQGQVSNFDNIEQFV